ncbi:MAG: hypothetical protein IJQ02_11795 [Oscillospiraceae bacterium]|nr:hypothetical protein [Oscillospiraceae bacterium]
MPRIDTSGIAGFEEMSAEEKLSALMELEIPEAVDLSRYVAKEAFDKKASEAASLSKQLKEKMTEEEKRKAEEDENLRQMKEELETLRRQNAIAGYTSSYVKLGYDEELAADTAEAMYEGDMQKVFENGEKHRAAMEKKIRAELMAKTPKPGGAAGGEDGKDKAVEMAKELARARYGNDRSYGDIMKNYRR